MKHIRKPICFFVGALAVVFIGVMCLRQGKDKLSDEQMMMNRLGSAMGGTYPESNYTLDADDIQNIQIKYDSKIPILSVLEQRPGYEKYYKGMLSLMENLQNEEGSMFYEKGYYLSRRPIRFFDACQYKMSNEEWIVVFSEDFSSTAYFQLFYDNQGELSYTLVSGELPMLSVLEEEQDEKFIFIFNGRNTLVLDSDNNICYGQNDPKGYFVVEGDYYHTLEDALIGISYREMINEENLIWIEY